MINTNINQKKNEFTMEEFFAGRVNPLEDYTEEQYENRDRKFDEQNKILDASSQLAEKLIKNGELPESINGDAIYQYFLQDDLVNKEFNDTLKKGRKNNKELAEIDNLKSNLAEDIFEPLGFTRYINKPTPGKGDSGSRGRVKITDSSYYQGLLLSYAELDKKGRQQFKTVFDNILEEENAKASASANGTGGETSLSQIRSNIIEGLQRSGMISERVYDIVDERTKQKDRNWKTVWGERPKSFDSMFKSQKINKEKEQEVKEEVSYVIHSFKTFMESRRNF